MTTEAPGAVFMSIVFRLCLFLFTCVCLLHFKRCFIQVCYAQPDACMYDGLNTFIFLSSEGRILKYNIRHTRPTRQHKHVCLNADSS